MGRLEQQVGLQFGHPLQNHLLQRFAPAHLHADLQAFLAQRRGHGFQFSVQAGEQRFAGTGQGVAVENQAVHQRRVVFAEQQLDLGRGGAGQPVGALQCGLAGLGRVDHDQKLAQLHGAHLDLADALLHRKRQRWRLMCISLV